VVDDPDSPVVGDRSCTVLDDNNYPHISYAADSTYNDLRYAFWDGTQWVIETADSAQVGAGACTAIALDSSGKVHVSYCERGGTWDHLRYARRDGPNTWFTETVDADPGNSVGLSNSIGVDSTGTVHIAYSDSDNDDLKYAVGTGGSWSIQTVDGPDSVAGFLWMDLDSSGRPHIVYNDATNAAARYTYWNGVSWSWRPSIPNAAWPRLALDSTNTAHVAYVDRTTYGVQYAVWNGMSWALETVDSTAYARAQPGLGVGPNGVPQIAYQATTGGLTGSLKLAVRLGPNSWDIETVDDCGQVWRNLSLAVGSANDPQISYYRFDTKGLWYAVTRGPLAVRWPRE
jgi:hypothetical protein